MEADPSKRYGNLHHGAGDVFAHRWFSEVDWEKLRNREIQAPYLPRIAGDGDASAYVSVVCARCRLARSSRVLLGSSGTRRSTRLCTMVRSRPTRTETSSPTSIIRLHSFLFTLTRTISVYVRIDSVCMSMYSTCKSYFEQALLVQEIEESFLRQRHCTVYLCYGWITSTYMWGIQAQARSQHNHIPWARGDGTQLPPACNDHCHWQCVQAGRSLASQRPECLCVVSVLNHPSEQLCTCGSLFSCSPGY